MCLVTNGRAWIQDGELSPGPQHAHSSRKEFTGDYRPKRPTVVAGLLPVRPPRASITKDRCLAAVQAYHIFGVMETAVALLLM
jgi:hypothetical protein